MSWLYLLIASIFEVGWPVGLKLAQGQFKLFWIIFAIFAMALSGIFLYLAQKQIPIGTAYAIWTGIGTICTFLIGITMFNETSDVLRFVGVFLILTGVIILKLSH